MTKNNEERQTIRRRSSSGQSRTRLSGRQSDLVNEALSRYFRTHEKLPLLEEISLRPEKAEYTGLRNLVLLKDDDCIGTLDEFGERYPRLYNEILRLLVEFAKQPQTEEKPQTTADQKPEVPAEEADLPQAEPAQPELDRAEAYIEKINALNTEIANESITNGLYQTCALLKHLAIAEEKFPENKDKLDKLYQYYLPILLDILENYKNIGQSASNHEDFHEAEDRLNKTIILINEAMKTISATMAEDDLMSLSADMTTLEALLKKDGLVQEGTLSGVRK
ncbi:5-bromo-4-chloroindolyl phosphate hydrolysis family protein [Holdemania sp. Marseille-P2844]|uniref:5-bromo-4-chloroindolyl phosphate hydrolysis family protein n=1 Tax=Holdemania sp. Marseille-P2844 TaxID=1852366 RepID=UPI0011148B22|nr:5-bromo-4-chloroindolyl phosphate hydrolysis family protein [Holdemania sp. Marseille-P2844]